MPHFLIARTNGTHINKIDKDKGTTCGLFMEGEIQF